MGVGVEIVLDSVRKVYGGTTAVDGVSLTVGSGQSLCLLGTSGCGKTTTLKMINRLIEPTAGRITIGGADVAGRDPIELRRSIGYVIQGGALFPHLTVEANVGLVARLCRWDEKRIGPRVRELLELVHLDPDQHARRYPGELSGGQRQRVGVARALMAEPPVVLMDEPFGAVDPLVRAELQAEFRQMQRSLKLTVVIVTHDLAEAFRLGDRVALMNEGKLVQSGTPDELARNPATPFVQKFLAAHGAAA